MTDLQIPPAALAAHADLSLASRRFLEALGEHPEWLRPIAFPNTASAEIPAWALHMLYPLQAWPTFIDAATIREIEIATTSIASLVQQVAIRVFDGDVARICRYFDETPERTTLFVEPPDMSSSMVARTDFIISERGIQCLEVNLSARLGGWQLRFWEGFCRNRPGLSEMLAEHGLVPVYRDPLRELFSRLIDRAVQTGIAANGEVNLVLLLPPNELEMLSSEAPAYLRALFREQLQAEGSGLGGGVWCGSYPDAFETRRGRLYLRNGKRVHALFEYGTAWTPLEIYRFAKSGQLLVYNGPLQRFGADKRCLALLSEHASSGLFSDRERDLIERYVPWGRELIPGPVEYQGERHDLAALLCGRRDDFVIKKGRSWEGRDVVVGRYTPAPEWERLLDRHLAEGGWLVQERVESRPYLYQYGEEGTALHSVVWGTFSLGDKYGGGFLRMDPLGHGDGVINAARGAVEGFIFEV